MTTNNNMLALLNMLRQSANPQQAMINLMSQSMGDNPFFANLLNLAQSGKGDQIETIARNIMRERGLDFDKEFNNFRRTMGL